jgi:hypothetical protein
MKRWLTACRVGSYNADERAATALLRRNRQLLRQTLHENDPPAAAQYLKGLFLARCDDPEAVPILRHCVGKYQISDKEMFRQIARLARREDLPIVTALPAHVRADQLPAAMQAVEAVRQRLEPAGAR